MLFADRARKSRRDLTLFSPRCLVPFRVAEPQKPTGTLHAYLSALLLLRVPLNGCRTGQGSLEPEIDFNKVPPAAQRGKEIIDTMGAWLAFDPETGKNRQRTKNVEPCRGGDRNWPLWTGRIVLDTKPEDRGSAWRSRFHSGKQRRKNHHPNTSRCDEQRSPD